MDLLFRQFEKGQCVNFLGKNPWVFCRIPLDKPQSRRPPDDPRHSRSLPGQGNPGEIGLEFRVSEKREVGLVDHARPHIYIYIYIYLSIYLFIYLI